MALFLFFFSLFPSLPGVTGETQLPEDGDCQSGISCRTREQSLPVCPAGFFCPGGNSTPVPCPPGTFRPEGAALPSRGCLPCPADFFNPRPGQKSCVPCGSRAVQPAEGRESCVCLGKGKVFQPRDALCTCPPGYRSSGGDGGHCVRQTYGACRDSASRNQEGKCLSKRGWGRYCSEKVCAVPRDYQGYDKALGLCVCGSGSLEGLCDPRCRRQHRDTLQLACARSKAQLLVTHSNGSKAAVFLQDLRTVLPRPHFSLEDACAPGQGTHPHPAHLVEMSGKGFLGVYNPDPQLLHDLIMLNEASPPHKIIPPSATAPGQPGREECRDSQEQRPPNSTSHTAFRGVSNPIACIGVNGTLVFIVSREHYPVYDVNNLYNTNAEFDWGDFRSLREGLRETSQKFLLFLFQFQAPGTFVMRLSSDRHKRMYVRVMPPGGQCYEEGPFFPTTPRFAVQVGIARKREILLRPDWAGIAGVVTALLTVLAASVALTLLCQGLGWAHKGSPRPAFRRRQLKYSLDRYSSSIPAVFSIRKRHPSLQDRAGHSRSAAGTACSLRRGDAWEPEGQVDLEAFDTEVFFELLLGQSRSVTATLGRFKEEVKIMYRKVTNEISWLKNLWIKALSIPGKADESTGTEGYRKAKQQAEEEMGRRKELAAGYGEAVGRQRELLEQELEAQEQHWLLFHSALGQALRAAEALAKRGDPKGNPTREYSRLLAQVEAASSRMAALLLRERQRLGAPGEGTGAPLPHGGEGRTPTRVEPAGSAGAPDVVCVDPTTGLCIPFPHCSVLSSQCPGPFPGHHFLHPETGKVLPTAGNAGYDPIRSRLVCAADSGPGERHEPEAPLFPYIPYPVCPSTHLPVKTELPALCPKKMSSLGGLMPDPGTGIEVPVLGVTVHPHSGQVLAVGGTYLNPLTGVLAPLEIWGPMAEPEGGKIVPILGVSLDGSTGEVLPLGGLVDPSGRLKLLWDSFTDPLSGKPARILGVHLRQGKVVPHSGGHRAALENRWILSQTQVLEALRLFQAAVLEDSQLAAGRLAALKASVGQMQRCFATECRRGIHSLRSLREKQEAAANIGSNGGKLGMVQYPGTEMWIPAVFGMKIPDPGGSSLTVPILGMGWDWDTGQPSPLAGTMEDANGKGLVPIAVGARAVSPITGELGPVIGAQSSPWTHNVIPTVQALGALPRRATDPHLLDFLEKEINSRRAYWTSRRKKEEGLLKKLDFLFLHILDAAEEGKAQQTQLKERLKGVEEMWHFLRESSLQEAERRASTFSSSHVATELPVLLRADREEKDQEMQVLLEIRKALGKLLELLEKMQLEEERMELQLREQQRGHGPGAGAAAELRLRKAVLAAESEEWMLQQQESVETAHTKLEYLRELSNIQMQQAKVLLSGSPQCFENYQTTGFYGITGVSRSAGESLQQKLIPLLRSVVQMLEENRKNSESPGTPGCSSRSTLKASAAHTEEFRTEESQENAPASQISPVVLPSPSERIPHTQQEMQTRFLWEKHSCERAHLELSLLAEEMGTVCSFYDSSKECRKGNGGTRSRKGPEAPGTLESLLEELSEHHSQAGQALLRRHLEEIQHSGLSPDLTVPKQTPHFLGELPHQLSLCLLGLQSPGCDFSEQQKPSWDVEHSPDSITRMLQVSGMKIVKLEALRQICLYRVLDLYSDLQMGACPEGVARILNYKNQGEEVAREVAEGREEQQAERAVAFLQEHHREGDLLRALNAEAEAELRKLQAQLRLELQTHTEEKLQAKETQVIQESKGEKFGDVVAYSLLSHRHLRQTVTLLLAGHRLGKVALRSQKEGTGLEQLVVEDLSMDEDTRDILHLLKDNTEYLFLVLEFIQTVRLLQLRETHLLEMVRSLNGCSQKFVDEANATSNEVQKFREQKMRRLKEQLKHLLENKRIKNISSNFDPLQSLMEEGTERKASLGKDFHPDLEKLMVGLGGDKQGKMQQSSHSPSDIPQSFQAPGTQPKAQDQLLLFLTESIKELKQAGHLMASRVTLLNPQLPAPPLHGGEMECKIPSFLLGLLKEVSDELPAGLAGLGQSHKQTAIPAQGLQDASRAQEWELTAVDPAALPAREFVVFQYGLSILHFLRFHIQAPEISLCVASSLPQGHAPGSAFSNSFFYQHSKKKLFILRDCLSSVGGFLLLLVHCLAHVAAHDLSHDSKPLFLRLFYQALKACLSEMFSLSLQLSAAAQGDKSHGMSQMLLKEDPFSTEDANLISQLFEVKNLPDTEALEKKMKLLRMKCEEPLKDKWLVKKKEHFLHSWSSSGRRASFEEEAVNSLSPPELEDKVDALTEELVQIIEDEHQFLNSKGNEDLLCYYLEITSLEKDCLVKQINALEEEIALGREL